MNPYYADEAVTLYHGDSREVLPALGPADVVITDPPYSSGRSDAEFAATGNIAVILHIASQMAPTMLVFGTSSGRGIEFIRSSVRALPHNRVLAWHRTFVNSPAAGPWAIVDLCKLRGLHWYHPYDSRRSNPGWPDLVITGTGILFRELKTRAGRLTFHQQLWAHRLTIAGQDWDVWRPADLRAGRIQMELETIR